MESLSIGPPDAVVKAFEVKETPVALAGGKGGTWRAGELILKPVEFADESNWRSEVLAALPESEDFRVARPVRALDGTWMVEGWEASRFVAGTEDVSRMDDVLRAGIAFHAAIAGLARPAFLDARDDPWSFGDRVAWEEATFQAGTTGEELLRPLLKARLPVELASQAVHGDLPGNVLFADGLPPAIIDWPLYWRPPSWAAAVAVVDALCWYDASPDLVLRWAHLPAWGQMLVRALIYRMVTDEAVFGPAGWTSGHADAYKPAIDAAVRCAAREAEGVE